MTTSDPRLKNIEKITKLMDSQFKIGSYKFGLDPIINLVPFLGDGVSVLISGYLVAIMYQHGASGKLVIKMILNVIIDAVVGAIPFLGWIFDFYFKANEKNLQLLQEHYVENKHQGSGKNILTGIAIAILIIVIAIIYLVFKLTAFLIDIIF